MPCKPAISSHSLGRAWVHDMRSKLDHAARYGFDIELFYEDLFYVAKEMPGGPASENLKAAARIIRSLCDERGMAIVCLQPFMHYEGLRDRSRHAHRIDEMRLWIELACILNTNIISIPSTFLAEDEASGDLELIVHDLREAAELGAPHGVSFAYESLAWGTYCDTWERCWQVVKLVDRPNFGLCLDTFNIAARVYADPASATRKTAHAEEDTRASLQRLREEIDVRKIFYIQVVDAEYLAEPLVKGHTYFVEGQSARMTWSRNCRLFYGEEERGAYLPIKDILRTLLVDLGFQGWVSAELFNRSLEDADASVPQQHARRAALAWDKMVSDFDMKGASKLLARQRSVSDPPRAQL